MPLNMKLGVDLRSASFVFLFSQPTRSSIVENDGVSCWLLVKAALAATSAFWAYECSSIWINTKLRKQWEDGRTGDTDKVRGGGGGRDGAVSGMVSALCRFCGGDNREDESDRRRERMV
jgi:hypothetical protein